MQKPLTQTEKIKACILKNPTLTNADVAQALDSTDQFVVKQRSALRKEGKLPKLAPGHSRRPKAEKHPALAKECEVVGIPTEDVSNYWYKGKHFSVFVKGERVKSYDEIKDDLVADMRKHSPRYPVVKYKTYADSHLLVVDPADIHIGKLCRAFETGEEHDNKIIVNRVHEGVDGIINKAQWCKFDQILFIIGNDILHVDNPRRTTTSGTNQDTDGMWYENFLIAKKLYIDIIEKLIGIAPVVVQYDPSNHDYINGFFLADTLSSWFSKSKNVEFKVSIAHRKYHVYHKNLIGTTHGDGAKEKDLGFLMAHEASAHWDKCKHRYFYTHHLHHKVSKDYMSVCVETLRSPSGTDSWHHRNGYAHAPKAVEGFIHHKEHGQIARITNIF